MVKRKKMTDISVESIVYGVAKMNNDIRVIANCTPISLMRAVRRDNT